MDEKAARAAVFFCALAMAGAAWAQQHGGEGPASAKVDDPYGFSGPITQVAGGAETEKAEHLWDQINGLSGPLKVYFDPQAKPEQKAQATQKLAAAVGADPDLKQVMSRVLGEVNRPAAAKQNVSAAPTEGGLSQQQWQRQEQATSLAVTLDPQNPVLRARDGEAKYYTGRSREAFDEMGQAIQMGQVDSQSLTLYGRAAYDLGDFRLAAQSGKMAYEMDASNKDAATLYGLSHERASKVSLPSVLSSVGSPGPGMDSGAGASLQEAAAQLPSSPESAAARADSPSVAAAMQAAAALAGPAKQSAALSTEAEHRLGVRDYSSAMALANQAIALDAHNAAAWAYRAIADKGLKFYPEAVRDASAALNLLPGNSVALQTRAWAFAKQGHYQEALADANASLESDPSGVAFYNRAFALAGLGRSDAAMESLQKAAQADARIQPKLDQALNLPNKADIMLVFDDEEPAARPAAPPSPGRLPRFWRLVLLSASGGLLFALGFLNVFSTSFRQRVHATVRRALGSPAPAAAPAGRTADAGEGFWGQYAMARPIGSGGMGVVYEAVDRSLERKVAIKRMREEIRSDPTERRRFVTEAKTVAGLHHPGIVDIYSIVEEGPEVYLVFEYVAGQTMADLLKTKGRLGLDAARRALAAVAQAVDYAHRRKVIHRDLKPSNLMVSEDGAVKVMDFGVARQAQEALTRTAHTNTVVGTPAYMAPEQEQGEVRPESDVFALAVCFYEMLTGALPFEGVGAGMLLNKLGGKLVPASRRVAGLPAGLDLVLSKALAPDPGLRYRTAGEFSAAVDAVAAARAA